jgi:ABC-type transporter Mla MlaB component
MVDKNNRTENRIVLLSGKLNSDTVPLLSKNNRELIKGNNSNITFDLAQITSSDNIGVSLLVDLASYAKTLHKRIDFINIPKQLLDLITIVRANEILPLAL